MTTESGVIKRRVAAGLGVGLLALALLVPTPLAQMDSNQTVIVNSAGTASSAATSVEPPSILNNQSVRVKARSGNAKVKNNLKLGNIKNK